MTGMINDPGSLLLGITLAGQGKKHSRRGQTREKYLRDHLGISQCPPYVTISFTLQHPSSPPCCHPPAGMKQSGFADEHYCQEHLFGSVLFQQG